MKFESIFFPRGKKNKSGKEKQMAGFGDLAKIRKFWMPKPKKFPRRLRRRGFFRKKTSDAQTYSLIFYVLGRIPGSDLVLVPDSQGFSPQT